MKTTPNTRRNPENPPTRHELGQKEHLCNTENHPKDKPTPTTLDQTNPETETPIKPTPTNKPQNQPKHRKPAEGRGSNPHPWLPLESNNGRAKASDVSPGTGNY